jgi:hypothetical protein
MISSNQSFMTEQPFVLSLAFELTYQLQDAEGSEGLRRTEARAFARGDCSFSPDTGDVTDFRMDEEEFV